MYLRVIRHTPQARVCTMGEASKELLSRIKISTHKDKLR